MKGICAKTHLHVLLALVAFDEGLVADVAGVLVLAALVVRVVRDWFAREVLRYTV